MIQTTQVRPTLILSDTQYGGTNELKRCGVIVKCTMGGTCDYRRKTTTLNFTVA